MKDPTEKIGVFGGSFDPIHTGHIRAAEQMLKAHGLQQILFIPARVSPFKCESPPTPFLHRVEMIQLAIQETPEFKCDLREGDRPDPSYTFDTILEIKDAFPRHSLHLLLGTDQVENFGKWHRADEILTMAEIIHMPRTAEDASSTQIRKLIGKNNPTDGLLTPEVAAYIKSNQLYAS